MKSGVDALAHAHTLLVDARVHGTSSSPINTTTLTLNTNTNTQGADPLFTFDQHLKQPCVSHSLRLIVSIEPESARVLMDVCVGAVQRAHALLTQSQTNECVDVWKWQPFLPRVCAMLGKVNTNTNTNT